MHAVPLRARRVGLAASALLLLACPAPQSSEDAGADAGVELSGPELCNRMAKARCELLSRCHAAFARLATEDCETVERDRCLAQYEVLKAAVSAGKAEIDSEKVLSCEERMRTSSCAPTFPPGHPSATAHPLSDCQLGGLLRGKVPSGQTCDFAAECAPGTTCMKFGDACRGTCSSFAKEGEACAFGCGPGLYCHDPGTPQDPSDDRCAAPKGTNATCDSSRECAPELYCRAGTCRPRGKAGEPCVVDPERMSTCDPGLACDVAPYVQSATGKCVVPLSRNEPCNYHWSCAPGLVCLGIVWGSFPSAAPEPGICFPRIPEGTNCAHTIYASYVGDECEGGQVCDGTSGKCAPIPRRGEACTPSSQSCMGLSTYCKPSGTGDFGTCTGPASIGERCAYQLDADRTVTIPCAAGYCDAQTTLSCLTPNKQLGQECSSDGECLSNRCAVQQDRTLKCAQACL